VTAYSPTQDGWKNGSEVWEETGADFYTRANGALRAGVAFDLPRNVTFTSVTLGLAYGDWLGFVDGVPMLALDVYLVDAVAPQPWSTANLPTTAAATQIATATLPAAPSPLSIPIAVAAVNAIAANPGWNGRIAFVLGLESPGSYIQVFSVENADPALRPKLVTVETITEADVTTASCNFFGFRFTKAVCSRG
jgi:hypothetical protein